MLDSSPLIVLGRLGRLQLLWEMAGDMVIPRGVADEILRGPAGDSAMHWILGEGQRWIRDTGKIDSIVAGWDLGTGETDVLSWASQNPGYEAIVDDMAARKCARVLGVPVRGTLGVLLLARLEGRIERMAPLLEQIRRDGFFIAAKTAQAILRLANEEPR